MKKFRQFKQIKPREEQKSRGSLYLSIFLAVLMVGAVGGIFLNSPSDSNSFSFGKHTFKPDPSGLWKTKIEKKDVFFYTLPDVASSVPVPSDVIELIAQSQGVVVAINPNHNESLQLQALDIFRLDLVDSLISTYPGKQVGFAVTQNTSLYNQPVVSCANATFGLAIMIVDYANETQISQQSNCISISAVNEQNLLTALDSLRYRIYGIINEQN